MTTTTPMFPERSPDAAPCPSKGQGEPSIGRRALLKGGAAVASVAVLRPSTAAAADADPIYAMIERHRAAHAAFSQAVADADRSFESEEDERKAEERRAVEDDLALDAEVDLINTIPGTLAGVQALADYLVDFLENGHELSDDRETIRVIMNNISIAIDDVVENASV